ncbi:hypothetical protein J4N42_15105 [Vibrio sp. SCSIO 43135]|uniref:hypothetical protein n=1 Tax=Vibrio sp. SCSIO 43135 TaxID=2819096 RepID=UPI002075409D|nr:hypothetical protein [Vibrio sp. SCSIO 43135]USD43503.1 hypothetical protein J4N42_15105 [Vibrio sp. SCSIO 43135]
MNMKKTINLFTALCALVLLSVSSFTFADSSNTSDTKEAQYFAALGFSLATTFDTDMRRNIGFSAGELAPQGTWKPMASVQNTEFQGYRTSRTPKLTTYTAGANFGINEASKLYVLGGLADYRSTDYTGTKHNDRALSLGAGYMHNFDFGGNGLLLTIGAETNLVDSESGQITHLITRVGWSF